MATILRKITLSKMGCDVKTIKAAVAEVDEGDTITLARVFGVASGYKSGQTDKGEYVLLLGEFSGANAITGETFASAKAILPTFIAENFVPVLQQHGNAEFAIEIGAKRSDSAVTGYEFTMRPLTESKSSDRLAALMQQAASIPMLEGPSKADRPAKSAAKSKAKGK